MGPTRAFDLGDTFGILADALNDLGSDRMGAKICDAAGQAAWEAQLYNGSEDMAQFRRPQSTTASLPDSSTVIASAVRWRHLLIINSLGAKISLKLERRTWRTLRGARDGMNITAGANS